MLSLELKTWTKEVESASGRAMVSLVAVTLDAVSLEPVALENVTLDTGDEVPLNKGDNVKLPLSTETCSVETKNQKKIKVMTMDGYMNE